MELEDVWYVAFGAASVRGIVHIGGYERLLELGLGKLKGVAGTSAGAMMALLVAIRVTPAQLKEIVTGQMLSPILATLCPRWTADNVFFALDFSLLGDKLRAILADRGFPPNVTFEELFLRTGVDLRVVAIHVHTRAVQMFSRLETPLASVVDAVVASSAIPIVARPERVLDSNLTCQPFEDGGTQEMLPMAAFQDPDHTLGLFPFDGPLRGDNPTVTKYRGWNIVPIDVHVMPSYEVAFSPGRQAQMIAIGRAAVTAYFAR